jgi:sugar O-acyltransferase (sialic acid O-acetyltransferase NeuD family)
MLIGLLGPGGFGREVMPLLAQALGRSGAELVFVETTPTQASVNGYKVISEEEFFARPTAIKRFNVAVGDSAARRTAAERFLARGAVPLTIKSPDSIAYDANEIGEGAVLCAGTIITSNARIGRFFQMNLQSYIAHDCVIGDYVTFAPGVKCNGRVVIGDGAYIGTGAILRNGAPGAPLRIGRGAVIGMGAVVTKDVPAGETWVGNPARKLEKR